MLTATCLTDLVARESPELLVATSETLNSSVKIKSLHLLLLNNSAKIGKQNISVDPLILFHRICVAKQSDEDLKIFFIFELSPFPLSLFNEEGMREGTKSSLFSAFTQTKIDAVQGLAPMKENLYFRKCGKGRTPDVLYSTTSFKYKFSRMILFIHAFSECDTTSALFGHGKTKFCSLLEKNKEKMQVFFNSEATIDQVAKAGETFLIHLYGGNPRTSACDLNHLRYTLFTQSATKARSTLECLSPTVDAARFHALRSYLQIQKW
ncbi:hypothetical protein AVEN_26590-1 [Araneus ventricosus]|uniref:Uncharacterized protein n=1 Tax=Araneus ventricosus TaxID=182803 RepID=A0A4Y2CFU8_ARAVE|nr:hypothetical protein AVEN_26590-1 [Araneus ventricosus]